VGGENVGGHDLLAGFVEGHGGVFEQDADALRAKAEWPSFMWKTVGETLVFQGGRRGCKGRFPAMRSSSAAVEAKVIRGRREIFLKVGVEQIKGIRRLSAQTLQKTAFSGVSTRMWTSLLEVRTGNRRLYKSS
jgi:hypothetical protein